MSTKPLPKSSPSNCSHTKLLYSSSSHAASTCFTRPTAQQRVAATTAQGTTKSTLNISVPSPHSFPAPLVLPHDDLALDPTYPSQSLRSWIREKNRNKVTPERRTIYLATSPDINHSVDKVKDWSNPRQKSQGRAEIKQPDAEDVRKYLEAFYFGMPVKMLPGPRMAFTPWLSDVADNKLPTKTKSQAIGLTSPSHGSGAGCSRIRTRPTPAKDFSHQLNLDDLLDAAIDSLPGDAYALVMLVEQDLYEDEDDEFVCGRAYGGSRVAVISTARYNPVLDLKQGVEREHAWPASHCEAYMGRCCGDVVEKKKAGQGVFKKTKNKKETIVIDSSSDEEGAVEGHMEPMEAAIAAHNSPPWLGDSPSADVLSGMWLGRVCRTAAHELGHCFGIDHCVYYACSMQGSASIIEDARQPPYLCSVDLAKVLMATGTNARERYGALSGVLLERGEE